MKTGGFAEKIVLSAQVKRLDSSRISEADFWGRKQMSMGVTGGGKGRWLRYDRRGLTGGVRIVLFYDGGCMRVERRDVGASSLPGRRVIRF